MPTPLTQQRRLLDPELEAYFARQRRLDAISDIGANLSALAVGQAPRPHRAGPGTAEMFRAQAYRDAQREQQRLEDAKAKRAAAIQGPYHPEQGGVPWRNPDAGQMLPPSISETAGRGGVLTGGILDEMPLNPGQRRLLDAATPDEAFGMASSLAFAKPERPIEVEGRLVSPTGEVVYEPDQSAEPLLEGTGLTQQLLNLRDRAENDPTFRGSESYWAIYDQAAEPRWMTDPVTKEPYQTRPNMTAWPKPTHPRYQGRAAASGAPAASGQAAAQVPAEAPGTALPGLSPDVPVEKAFGGQSVWQNMGNFLNDLVGREIPFPDTQDAMSALDSLRSETITLMATGRGGRPSNITIEEIKSQLPQPGSIWVGDQRAASKLRVMRDKVREQYQVAQQFATDASLQLSPADISTNRVDAVKLKKMLDWYDSALARFEAETPYTQGGGPSMRPGEVRQHPGGGTYELIVE